MPPQLPLLTLIIHLPDGGERRIDLQYRRTVIGRSSKTDLKIVSKQVSKRHAVIEIQDGVPYIRDLGSRNGVEINGRLIDVPHQLRASDNVVLGDVNITVDPKSYLFRSPSDREALQRLLEEEAALREASAPAEIEEDKPERQTAATVPEAYHSTRHTVVLSGRPVANSIGERPILRMLRIVRDGGPHDTARVEGFLLELKSGEEVWIRPNRDLELPPIELFPPAPNVWVDEPEDFDSRRGSVLARGTYYLPPEIKVVGGVVKERAADGRRVFAEAVDGPRLAIVPD